MEQQAIWARGVESLARELAGEFSYDESEYDENASSPYDSSSYSSYDAKSKDTEIDYSVLAVVVITLGLILVVEVVRHRIDHAAENRSFFRAVLDGVYGELSTLGIVEAGVHVVLSYLPSLDSKGKKVFADVHFLIFFIAVFNALMCVILAYFSTNVSHQLWVVAEQLELGHYVEAREEFDRIDAKLNEVDRAVTASTRESTTAESSFNFDWISMRKLWRTIKLTIRRPVLKNRHRRLLMQIRFHELRVHFLRRNGLTLKLKVSQYLKRSELHVLEHLVHISALSWVLLAGAVVLIYFILGVLAYVTDDPNKVIGAVASHVFVWAQVVSVVVSLLLFNKMKWIFSRIMKMGLGKKFYEPGVQIKDEDRQAQLDLFWGSHPAYVVSFVQFMQFGYAMAAAILLIYWNEIDKDGVFPAYAYAVACALCYIAFVTVMANTLPRYTMCTSLGNLVDSSRLAETVAHFRLEETKRMDADERTLAVSSRRNVGTASRDSVSSTADGEAISQLSELIRTDTKSLRDVLTVEQKEQLAQSRAERRMRRKKSNSDSRVSMMAKMKDGDDNASKSSATSSKVGFHASGVANDGGDIEVRQLPPPRPRRKRRKASSTGVAFMRSFKEDGDEDADAIPSQQLTVFDISALEAKGNYDDEDKLGSVNQDDDESEEEKLGFVASLKMTFEEYSLSSKYRLVSGVFGTLLCFFFIGMRVEVLLLENDTLEDPGNTFHFNKTTSFWLVFTWLAMMIIESSFRASYFWKSHPEIRYACALDLILAPLCLALFIWAEVERCCDLVVIDAETMESYEDADCCPQFGTRTYGSVGNIEPFTSLIALRVFRFYVGRWIAVKLGTMPKKPEKHHDHHHGHHALAAEHGNITQLWEKAVSLYPDVVKEHGELSGQLLKKMLGVRGSLVVLGDVESSGAENDDELVLVDPNAILTRSMRRCDYMLLPLFDEWRPMDVLMTQYEMVFIEAIDLDGKADEEMQIVRKAIAARKGGKGLRLADVLKGRKVISHIDLTTIEQVHVEHFPPTTGNVKIEYAKNSMLSEFWYLDRESALAHIHSRNTRWQSVDEQHLKIKSPQGTFYLRFYGDLDTCESKMKATPPKEVNDPFLIHALCWSRAIGRICGTRQLKQPLPHFGEKREIEDYLVQRHRGREEDHAHHSRLGHFMHVNMPKRGFIRRNSSMGSTDAAGAYSPGRPKAVSPEGTESGSSAV
eukprot:CAMPEP_0194027918 /NCGR_PEP_ID=MMETSP0009_2-20130614/1952_1 /TAXON_ID=210454 /ORGANISM="Grammatophora oceanica, Strain CCMP 410" /LENGTH=1205 /DNA_ID=CAMNT_0038667123 /DNA_START=99 /DNA_END=3716 /DNA_ORIENTATION=+